MHRFKVATYLSIMLMTSNL